MFAAKIFMFVILLFFPIFFVLSIFFILEYGYGYKITHYFLPGNKAFFSEEKFPIARRKFTIIVKVHFISLKIQILDRFSKRTTREIKL